MNEKYKQIVDSLTSLERLPYFLKITVRSLIGYVEDPIAHVCQKLLTEKISVVFINNGISIFKSDPSIIIPFQSMTKHELEILKSLLAESDKSGDLCISELRGGSACITLMLAPENLIFCRQRNVLVAVREILTPLKTQFKIDIVNIVIQRLLCGTKIPYLEFKHFCQHSQKDGATPSSVGSSDEKRV